MPDFIRGLHLIPDLIPGMMVETNYLGSEVNYQRGIVRTLFTSSGTPELLVNVQEPNLSHLGGRWTEIQVRVISLRSGRSFRAVEARQGNTPGRKVICIDRSPQEGECGLWLSQQESENPQYVKDLLGRKDAWPSYLATEHTRLLWLQRDAMPNLGPSIALAWAIIPDLEPARTPITGPGYYPGPPPSDY